MYYSRKAWRCQLSGWPMNYIRTTMDGKDSPADALPMAIIWPGALENGSRIAGMYYHFVYTAISAWAAVDLIQEAMHLQCRGFTWKMYFASQEFYPSFFDIIARLFGRCKYKWQCNIIFEQNTSKWTIVKISIFICLHSSLNFTQADMLMWLVSICVYICVCILHFLPSNGGSGGVWGHTHVHVRHICRWTCSSVYLRSTTHFIAFFSVDLAWHICVCSATFAVCRFSRTFQPHL